MSREKAHWKLCVLGHQRSGVSSLSGYLICHCGGLDRRSVEKYTKEDSGLGYIRLNYASIIDRLKHEIARSINIYIDPARFETKQCSFSILEGSETSLPNFYLGRAPNVGHSSNATNTVAIFVVSGREDEFEANHLAQQCDYTRLSTAFGVKHVVVCVNKMEDASVQWSESRFLEIKQTLSCQLSDAGHDALSTSFIPISVLDGDNMNRPSQSPLATWYNGPTVLAALDSLPFQCPPSDQPLRFLLEGVFALNQQEVACTGRLECGSLRVGSSVAIAGQLSEQRPTFPVQSIEFERKPMLEAAAVMRDLSFILPSLEAAVLRRGMVLIQPEDYCVRLCRSFVAHVVVNIEIDEPITVGQTFTLQCGTATTPARVETLLSIVQPKTSELLHVHPNCLLGGSFAAIQCVLDIPIVVEASRSSVVLSRVRATVGRRELFAGVVVSVAPSVEEE